MFNDEENKKLDLLEDHCKAIINRATGELAARELRATDAIELAQHNAVQAIEHAAWREKVRRGTLIVTWLLLACFAAAAGLSVGYTVGITKADPAKFHAALVTPDVDMPGFVIKKNKE